ncbi:MAG TPA: hypothetical protein VGK00_14985 [Anaerolineales bacterium]|jgi:hypothetical protein
MKKTKLLFVLCIFTGLLAACNLPAVATTPAATRLPTATETATSPRASAQPPEATSRPASAPATPAPSARPAGEALTLYQVHMLNATQGWGWASHGDPGAGASWLLRTSDGGQTWVNVSPQVKMDYYSGFFLNAQAAWLSFYDQAANTSGLLRTTDGGQTWSSLPSFDFLQNATVEFTDLNDGLALTAGVGAGNVYLNYYETHDGGTSWKPIPIKPPTGEPGLPTGTVHLCNICGDRLYYDPARLIITRGDMASDPSGFVQLSISTDLGLNWKNLKLPLPDPKYAKGSVSPISPVFFGAQGLLPVNILKYNQDGSLAFSVLAVYTTQDGGQSWNALPSVLETGPAIIDAVQFVSPTDAFVRCGSHLCSTRDGARTWQVLPDSLNFDRAASTQDYVSQVSFIDPSTGWAISGETSSSILWKSTDGGATWARQSPTLAK